mgnify:CR=1 FL=1
MATDGSVVTSIRLSATTKDKIDRLAAATGRSRSYLLAEAVERYIEYETWFVAQVEEAIRDEEELGHEPGYYVTTDEVIADLLAREVIDAEHWAEAQRHAST